MLAVAAPDPSSTVAWISLGIAVLSLGVSAFSLGWQVLQWRLTGSRVTVATKFGYGVGGQPPWDELITVEARNTGRTAVSVTGWGLRFDDETHIPGHAQQVPINESMPARLEPGAATTFYLPMQPTLQSAAEWAANNKRSALARGFVALGTGKEARATRPIDLARSRARDF